MSSDYVRDGAAIYRESFSIIRSEADLRRFRDPIEERVAVRMIHACGQVELAGDIHFSPGFTTAATDALGRGAPILADTNMVASGVTRARLAAQNPVICTLGDPRVPDLAAAGQTTRSAAAIALWPLAGALVVIGNAPTALFHLLDGIAEGALERPAAVIGVPVGFVGAAESKAALAASDLEHVIVTGRRGGSAIACGAVNALASEAE